MNRLEELLPSTAVPRILPDSLVIVRKEIEAQIPEGAPDNGVRMVTENSQAVKFRSHGCEKEYTAS